MSRTYTSKQMRPAGRTKKKAPATAPPEPLRERDIGLSDLADQVGLSPHYFSTLSKHAFGVSPHRYVLSERVHEAKRLLCSGQVPISEVALRLGFADQSHFSQVFRTFVGTTPKRFQTMC